MDQGLISNPKDLERMQHELESLERRITTLEDEELEVMARLEDAQRDLDELAAQRRRRRRAAGRRSAAPATTRPPRSTPSWRGSPPSAGPAADGLPDDLLALYDKLRAARAASAPRAARPPVQRLPAHPRQRRARRDPGRARRRGGPLRGVPADPGAHGRVRAVSDPFRDRRSSSRPTAAPAATPARRRTAPCSRTPTPAR